MSTRMMMVNGFSYAVSWWAMAPDRPASIEEQLEEIRARVLRLEAILRAPNVPVLQTAPLPSPSATSGPMEARAGSNPPGAPLAQTPAFTPSQAPVSRSIPPPPFRQPQGSQTRRHSLESRVGSQWFNRLGILAILIGMAWFLKLAIDSHWIGPLGRILIGLLSGAALIVWSERFRTRGYTVFAFSLKAVGSGILYLSLWAAFSLYHLLPEGVAFAAMIAVTAWNGFLAWRHDAELLALYAIVGGLGSPVLVSTGQNHESALFCYLMMLDLSVLVLVALRPWSRLLFGAFLGTVVYVAGWWIAYYTPLVLGQTALFLACFFLIFAFAPRLVRLSLAADGSDSAWDYLVIGLMPLVNAALGFIAFYGLFESAEAERIGPWLAVTFAAFYLLLLRLPQTSNLHKSPLLLSSIHLSTAVVFLTIALPLKAHGRWLTIGWLAEGASLLWAATRARLRLLGVLALMCLVLGVCALFVVTPDTSTTPFFNTRFATYCVAIAVFAFVFWLARRALLQDSSVAFLSWRPIAATSLLLINLLMLIGVSEEIHSFWLLRRIPRDFRLMQDRLMYEQFSYSAFFMAFGALVLAVGFWRRSSFLRWQALILLAAAVAKVFLVDVSSLSQGFRVLSFLGLGVLLLAVSFVYQRDWLNLRSRGDETS